MSWRPWLTNRLSFPSEVVYDLSRVTLVGNQQLYLENIHRLIKLTSTEIIIEHQDKLIVLKGDGLTMAYMQKEASLIHGDLSSIQWNKRKEN